MIDTSLIPVIDFAILRENEATEFYAELQKLDLFDSQIEMLKELEKMEIGHARMLENLKEKNSDEIKAVKEVEDLKISDYLVEVEPNKEMTYQDILIIAMKREEKAQKLYSNLAKKFPNSEISDLFNRLASEEAGHKNMFEKIYDEEVLQDN